MANLVKNGDKEITPTDVLGVFLTLQEFDGDSGDTISNMKAQKMLYYAQGWHLAKFGSQLFQDEFEAWQYGPVIPVVWGKLKEFGSDQIILKDEEFDINKFSEGQRDLLVSVYKTYGQFTAWKLRDMTHEESPWKDVFKPGVPNINISKESIAKYFKALAN